MRLSACVALSAFALACASAPEAKKADDPTVVSQEMEVFEQGLTDFKIRLEGQVKSPAAVRLTKADYEVVVEGKVIKTGEAPLDVAIPAGETRAFSVVGGSKYVSSAEELKAISGKGGSLLAAIRGKIVGKTEDGRTVEIPFARSRDVRVPRLPSVKLHQVDGARYSDEEVNTTFSLGVMNPNPFKIQLSQLTYAVTMADKQLAEGVLAKGESVDASATGIFEVTANLNTQTYGPDAKKVIKTLKIPWKISGELQGDLVKEPYTLDGELRLNVSR